MDKDNIAGLGAKVAKVTFVSMTVILLYLLLIGFIFSQDQPKSIVENAVITDLAASSMVFISLFTGFAILANVVIFLILIFTALSKTSLRRKALRPCLYMLMNIPVAIVYFLIIAFIVGPIE